MKIKSTIILLFMTLFLCPVLYAENNAATSFKGEVKAVVQDQITKPTPGALVKAAKENDLKLVKSLIYKNPAGVNEKDEDGNTALMIAAKNGYFDLIHVLDDKVGKWLRVNEANNDNYTALCLAVINNDLRTVGYLIGMKADVNYECGTRKANKGSPLLKAVEENADTLLIDVLVKSKANVNYKDPLGITPLMRAAHSGNIPVMDILIGAGADINAKVQCDPCYGGSNKKSSMAVVIWAIRSHKVSAVKYLIEDKGANPPVSYCEDGAYITPLDIAVLDGGGPEMVEYVKSIKGCTECNERGYHLTWWD